MTNTTRAISKERIETRFIFSQEIKNISAITDEQGQKLAFTRTADGNQVIFTKDTEGVDVAVEHTIDGGKVFHLSQDSKGLPAMHEFKPDGTEVMYLLDQQMKLEKMIETKMNGDKLTTWYYANGDMLMQEERQTGGILFRFIAAQDEALVWLKPDGSAAVHGATELVERLKVIFHAHLDGADL